MEDPATDIAFPDSVVDTCCAAVLANLPEASCGHRQQSAQGEPNTTAPVPIGTLIEATAELRDQLEGRIVDDEDLNGYLVSQVFLDYMGRRRIYGPVRALPTRTFSTAWNPGEITAEIDPGKILEIRLQAVGAVNKVR